LKYPNEKEREAKPYLLFLRKTNGGHRPEREEAAALRKLRFLRKRLARGGQGEYLLVQKITPRGKGKRADSSFLSPLDTKNAREGPLARDEQPLEQVPSLKGKGEPFHRSTSPTG